MQYYIEPIWKLVELTQNNQNITQIRWENMENTAEQTLVA